MAIAVLAAASTFQSTIERGSEAGGAAATALPEDAPEVFLAKATLQQYLSRVVRKDWDGVRRLTHAKALSAAADPAKGSAAAALAPWADRDAQLKTFRFRGARQVAPGAVAITVGEDVFHAGRDGMTTDEPQVYLLFRSHGAFVVGDKKPGLSLSRLDAQALRTGYRGYLDSHAMAQARRGPTLPRR